MYQFRQNLVVVFLFVLTSIVCAQDAELHPIYDVNALEYCSKNVSSDQRQNCMHGIQGKKFNYLALHACSQVRSDERLSCLLGLEFILLAQDTKEVTNYDKNALDFCTQNVGTDTRLQCILSINRKLFNMSALQACAKVSFNDRFTCLLGLDFTFLTVDPTPVPAYDINALKYCSEDVQNTQRLQCILAVKDRQYSISALQFCSTLGNEDRLGCFLNLSFPQFENMILTPRSLEELSVLTEEEEEVEYQKQRKKHLKILDI